MLPYDTPTLRQTGNRNLMGPKNASHDMGGKCFWTHQIPTSCLPTLLIFIHIEHTCTFFVTFFSATIDGRDLIFDHKLEEAEIFKDYLFILARFSIRLPLFSYDLKTIFCFLT
jgi:hypothetical protein